jgi:carbon-monoxide dehydrogenase medium subunit
VLPPFEIHQPATPAEACALRVCLGEDAALYAGGSELLLAMKEGLGAFGHLIDVKTVPELHRLEHDPDARRLTIGAAVTHRELERSPVVRGRFPLLAEMEAQVANVRVRAVGTLGGNLCFGEPHSDPPTALLVHEAGVLIQGTAGSRRLRLEDFLVGSYETALGPDEVLVAVEVPEPPPASAAAYLRFGLHERPTAGVAVLLDLAPDGREVAEGRVAVGCVGPVATRLPEVEAGLRGVSLERLARGFAPARSAGEGLDAVSDLHGSADYKRHLVGVLVTRALAGAAHRAGGGPRP